MKRTSNFNLKIGMALVALAAMSTPINANEDGLTPLQRAKARMQKANQTAANCGAQIFEKLATLDMNAQADAMDRRTQAVEDIIAKFTGQIEKMSTADVGPDEQHAGFSRLLEEIEEVPDFAMLEKTMNKMNGSTEKVAEISGRIKAVMHRLGVATAKAHEEQAENPVSKAFAKGFNFIMRRGDETLGEIFDQLREDLRTLTEEAGDVAREHWDDVSTMETIANNHLRKAEDLKAVIGALGRFREGIESNRKELLGDAQATAKLDQISVIDKVVDSLATILSIHQKMAHEMLGTAENGHAANGALKEAQLLAHMAVALQIPILAAETSNAVALKMAKGMLEVTEMLEEAVTTVKNGNAANFKRMSNAIVKQQKKLLASDNRTTRADRDYASGLKVLDQAAADRRKNRLENIKKSDEAIATRQARLKERGNAAKGNVIAAQLLGDKQFASVIAEEIQAGKIDAARAQHELDAASDGMKAKLERAKLATAEVTGE